MPDRRPGLSVVVPTKDRPQFLAACLASLAASVSPADEVIVVDSASAGPETARVAEAAGTRVLRAPRPGASLARNIGWHAARHEDVAFVDDDVRVAPDWADAIVAALGVADFVTGRLAVPPAQQHVEAAVAVLDAADPADITAAAGAMPGHSANLGVRRAALEAVGGFDECLGPGHRFVAAEDGDLFDRLLAAGFRGRYEPAALGWHAQWRDRRSRLRLDWNYGIGAGARLAKLARTDRRRARIVGRDVVVRWGLQALAGDLRRGYRFAVATDAARLAGVTRGFVAALPVPVRDGHYAPGRRRPASEESNQGSPG